MVKIVIHEVVTNSDDFRSGRLRSETQRETERIARVGYQHLNKGQVLCLFFVNNNNNDNNNNNSSEDF